MSCFVDEESGGAAIGIVGATGAVGIEIISVLERLSFPVSRLRLFASARSAGKVIKTGITILLNLFRMDFQ